MLPNSFYTENIGFLLKVIVSFYKLEALRTTKVKSFNTYKSKKKENAYGYQAQYNLV
jgi:hypothetical protein